MHDDRTTIDLASGTDDPSLGGAHLVVLGSDEAKTVSLPRGRPVSIGRAHSSEVLIKNDAVSRLHATVIWNGGATVLVTDHGSRNGTLVDGQAIDHTLEAASGAEIVVGGVHIIVAVTGEHACTEGEEARASRSFVASDPAMLRVLALADRAAGSATTVLLVGETGVGKEVVARRIHERSGRTGAFVAVNSGAIPESLAESTLFGHESGAFTGATQRQSGYFEDADGGTLFLDEVGELATNLQVKLLRVIQEREVVRVGGHEPIRLDVRLVAATNADLAALVRAKQFREDLLYRLDVLRIEIPPLRERPKDIVPLALHFLRQLCSEGHVAFSPKALESLRAHSWPGNVRDLRNVIERALAVREHDVIEPGDLWGAKPLLSGGGSGGLQTTIDETEREAIQSALDACQGNQTQAARRLGISRRALIYRMERLGLKRPPPSQRD